MLNLKELLNPATPPARRSPSPPPPPAPPPVPAPAPVPLHTHAPVLISQPHFQQPPSYSSTSSYTPPKPVRESISLDQIIDRNPTPKDVGSQTPSYYNEESVRSEHGKGAGKRPSGASTPRPQVAGKSLPALKHLSTHSRRPTQSPSGSEQSSRSSTPEKRDREETIDYMPELAGYMPEQEVFEREPEPIAAAVPAPTKKRKQPTKKKSEKEKEKKVVGDGAPKKKKGIAKVSKKKAKTVVSEPIVRAENGNASNGFIADDEDTTMTGLEPKFEPRSDNMPSSEMGYDARIPVFCICRKPDNGSFMIGCDGCDEWFHGDCVNIAKSDEEHVDKYFCDKCESEGKGITSWKRTCRLPGCRRPARTDGNPPSKYCSPEHGKQFFILLKCRAEIQAEKAVPPRQLAAVLQKLAVTPYSNTAQDFKALGERIPTPPLVRRLKHNPSLDKDGRFEPELSSLEKAASRLAAAQNRKTLIDQRAHFLSLAITRAKPVTTENGKQACGFDPRLSLADEEFPDLAEEGYPELPDPPSEDDTGPKLCTSPTNCPRHKGWQKKFADDVAYEERLVMEEVAAIKAEEKRVNEVLKLKVIGLEEGEREGWTEREM